MAEAVPGLPRHLPDRILALPILRVMELSENIKLRFDPRSAQNQSTSGAPESASAAADETGHAAEAESQMRKALGLMGDSPRHRPDAERMDQSGRGVDRFNGGLHRRRFVQDGDVPVTVLRREPGHEAPAHRSAAAVAAPSSSRLQRTEAALAVETAARERVEKALAETQSAARDLQTRIGHADLAKHEAIEALQREREAMAELHAEIEALNLRAQDAEARAETAEQAASEHQVLLADQRQARKALEIALHAAETARDAARHLVQTLSDNATATADTGNESAARRRSVDESELVTVATRRGRPPAVVEPEAEPEPVKWWLNPKPAMKRR